MIDRLLNYWYTLEFFQPTWPIKENEDINLLKGSLPWDQKESDPKTRLSYDLYLGQTLSDTIISWALKSLVLIKEDTSIEHDHSKTCFCALKVDEDGLYVANSFALSSFVWALAYMVQKGNFNVRNLPQTP